MSNGTSHLVGQLAVQVHDASPAGSTVPPSTTTAVGVDHLAGEHLRRRAPRRTGAANSTSTAPPRSRTRAGPEPSRTGNGAARAQLSGTGSRISARASGAAARSASADSSSGCCCERTSASTRAQVGVHLAVDVLGAPTQHGRNDFGDLAGAVHAAVRVLDRDPHPPGQDVLEMQRALGRRRVPRPPPSGTPAPR